MKKTTLTLLTVLAAGSASAAILVTESFDTGTYTAGSDLNGQNSWSGSNNIEVDAAGLTNAGMLGETGYSIRGVTSFTSAGQGLISLPTVGSDSNSGTGELWFAGLISMTDGSFSPDYNYFRFRFDSSGSQNVEFGLLDNQFVAGGSTNGFVGVQYSEGTTALIVGKMEVTGNGTETFDFWFNPTNATSEATLTSTAQGTILNKSMEAIFGDWGSVTIGANMRGNNINNQYQDEMRVGETLSDLNLAVPEPSAYALFAGLAVLGVVYWRRRR